jgi:hypothetical protein
MFVEYDNFIVHRRYQAAGRSINGSASGDIDRQLSNDSYSDITRHSRHKWS